MEWIAAVLGLWASLAAALLSWFAKERAEQAKRKRVKELYEIALNLGPVSVSRTIEVPRTTEAVATPELLRDIERTIVARVEALPLASREAMQQEIEMQMGEVKKRIEKIENRFPEEAQIEKIASINDALLSERIDQLSKQVQAIESRILTKWDVALTVSAVVTGIIVVVGATYAVLKAFGKVP